jgi:hypothetical protein
MPSSGDYQTVGALYESIRQAFDDLCTKSGERTIFCGATAQQIGPLDSPLPGLRLVASKEDALAAIDTIITQGEGGADVPDSQLNEYKKIKGNTPRSSGRTRRSAGARRASRDAKPSRRRPSPGD